MKIEDFGSFQLKSNSNEYELKIGANLICIHRNYIDNCVINADCIFVINIEEDDATLLKVYGDISVLGKDEVTMKVHDNMSFKAANISLHFYFRHTQDKLEELVDCFMDGNLTFPLDMNAMFYQYAKQLKITDRKAISNVMAVIDIPEIDNL